MDTSILQTGMPPFVLLQALIQWMNELLKPTFLHNSLNKYISGQNFTSSPVDIPLSHNTLINRNFKIQTGIVPQAGWTGPHFPNNVAPGGGILTKQVWGNTECLYNIIDDPEPA